MTMEARFTTAATAIAYIQGGNATVTLRSAKTSTRFTYKVAEKDTDDGKHLLFVGLLRGADNESDYQFLGTIFPSGEFRHGKRSRIGMDAPSARAWAWAWEHLRHNELPQQLEVWHEGSCGRCGRKLTVPESVESGFGPECRARMGRAA